MGAKIIISLCQKFNFSQETIHLSVCSFYRYIELTNSILLDFKLIEIASTCVFFSAKF
jgi:hypothetical protein